MNLIDCGSGRPIVLVPGVQGRWEWMRPTVDALAQSFRVLTFSLCDERARGRTAAAVLDDLSAQIRAVLDPRDLERATICGVSFGGLIALHFAAHHPDRTEALVLASTPGPGWQLRRSHQVYVRWPRLCAPLFFAGAPRRLRQEIARAIPDRTKRRRFRLQQLALLIRAPLSPSRMAARARLIASIDVTEQCRAVSAPTLILCGEPQLDHVVSVGRTTEYERLIARAQLRILPDTGHLGHLTRPDAFAAAIRDFLQSTAPRQDYAA
jgi:pimeloyl-ACP methyl ester carboxylesterase